MTSMFIIFLWGGPTGRERGRAQNMQLLLGANATQHSRGVRTEDSPGTAVMEIMQHEEEERRRKAQVGWCCRRTLRKTVENGG